MPASTTFAQRSARSQVARLRPLARAALALHGLADARLQLLNHGFNTTFRVDTADGRRFALRLNVNSRRTPANLRAEAAWLCALARDTDLAVPVPRLLPDGSATAFLPCDDLGRPVAATLFSWLPGPDLHGRETVARMRSVGRTTAALHEHVARWSLPAGAELPALDCVLLDVENRLHDDRLAEALGPDRALLTAGRQAVIHDAFAEVQARYEELFPPGAPAGGLVPLHADLHNANLKWHRGRPAVLDFDDSGLGHAVQDLAITMYYLRDAPALEEAVLAGYADVRPLPSHTTAQFEAIVAGRNLLLLNDLVATTLPAWRAMLPRYLVGTAAKLRAYLDTGVYRHEVPGLPA